MRWNALWWFVPDAALPLILIGGAFLVMLGLVRPGRLLLFVLGFALLPMLGPVIEAVFELLPWWVTLLVMAGVAISMMRAAATLLLGPGAADHMVGTLAAGAVGGLLRAIFMIPVLLVRGVGWLFMRV